MVGDAVEGARDEVVAAGAAGSTRRGAEDEMTAAGAAGGTRRGAEREERAMKAVRGSEGAETAGGNEKKGAERGRPSEGGAE